MYCRLGQVCSVLLLVSFATAGPYVPGTPGGPWTKQELLHVKSKLYGIFKWGRAPQALRLSFHDCVKYQDGTGGCDGCLNWEGVDVWKHGVVGAKNHTNMDSGDNNGLGDVVRELEKIYTEPNYPWFGPELGVSLKDSGKSRADLWAYAGQVAIEWGVEGNNLACEDWNNPRTPGSHCVHEPGTEECFTRPSRDIQFQYGRSDCTEHDPEFPYKALKAEHHPNPVGDGPTTIEYMKNDFGFTGRETAAIFGAHTFGHPKLQNSLIPYTWTSAAVNMINNDYYKNIVGLDRWFIDDNKCRHVGDAYGNKPKTRWLAHTRKMTQRGGPIFWIHQNHVCPSVYNDQFWGNFERQCIEQAGPGQQCIPDPPAGSTVSRTQDEEDGNADSGCERWRLIIGKDEIALNCEMGLYLDFTVTEGVIHGCEGLEHFGEKMANNKTRNVWSREPGQTRGWGQPGCAKQNMSYPIGDTPLYKIMEEYAHDNNLWIDDFYSAYEKMVHNGYWLGQLQNATTVPQDQQYCPLPIRGAWDVPCYEKEEAADGPAFMIGTRFNLLDSDQVMQYDEVKIKFNFGKMTGEPNQLWKMSVSGEQFINQQTGMALSINGYTNFRMQDIGNDNFKIVIDELNKVADAWPAQNDSGNGCTVYWSHGGSNQQFYLITPTL